MKLARKCFAQYLDSTFDVTKSSPAWFLVGKNVDEMSTELNPDVTVGQDVTGENYTEDNGYTPSVEVDPYYANPSDGAFYEKLVDIAKEHDLIVTGGSDFHGLYNETMTHIGSMTTDKENLDKLFKLIHINSQKANKAAVKTEK